ncbi:MAG: hypothetical protein ACREE4_18945 [Stellaceae bacterium]
MILGAEIEAEIAAWRYGHKPSAVKRMLEEREKISAPDAERR